MVWDGIFHALTWTMTAAGLTLLWRTAQKRETPLITSYFVGSLLLGWGLFNFVEGIIDHHILQLHHVVERAEGAIKVMWDLSFLASGILMITIGIYRRREHLKEPNLNVAKRWCSRVFSSFVSPKTIT